MVPNLYKTLGVTKDASKSDIDESYRRLARKYHPDLNQGDPSAKERFQEVQHAAEILRDENKRRNYDELLQFLKFNYGIDLDSVSADEATTQDVEPASGPDEPARMELERVFRAFSPREKDRDDDPIRGLDLHRQLEVPFTTSVVGGEVPFELQRETKSNKVLVKIPPGIENGWKLRLRGQGKNGKHGGDPGDLILTVFITPDPQILRHGKNLEIEVPVDGAVAKFGGKVNICTPRGEITLTVPPGTLHEQHLRIIGLGVVSVDGNPGDLIACIKVVGPLPIDEEPSSPTDSEIDIDDQEDPTKHGCNDTQETVNSAMPVPSPHGEAVEEPSESLAMFAKLDSEHDSFEPHVSGEPVGEVEELAIQPEGRHATREAIDPETVQQLERDVVAAQGQEVESTQRGESEEPRKSDNPPKESEPASSSNSSEQSETATHDAEHHGFIVFLGVLSFALFLISVLGWGWQPDSIFTPSFSNRAASGTPEVWFRQACMKRRPGLG
jgi:DnaJ-class molecular chaperone